MNGEYEIQQFRGNQSITSLTFPNLKLTAEQVFKAGRIGLGMLCCILLNKTLFSYITLQKSCYYPYLVALSHKLCDIDLA